MCGIAGIWKFDGSVIEEDALRSFTDSISHRGPDGSGYWMNEKKELGLGHRRLSILDTSEGGKQPMVCSDKKFIITFNGEIFNFIELKKELSLEYNFTTGSDTEVILAAYAKWGKDCLLKFNGMWALAIYNLQTEELFLARDRFGIKPLYYLDTSKAFCFASETYAFKFLSDFRRELDETNIRRAISHSESIEGYGYTIFKDIYQLLPGHYIQLRKNHKPVQKRWWSTKANLVSVPEQYEDQKKQFFELFRESCKLRLRSDVSIATALSGGVDSSAVYCMIKHLAGSGQSVERLPSDWQRAFIATFPGEPIDEKEYAQYVLKYTGSEGNFVEVDYKNICDDLYKTTKLFDSISDSPINAISNVYGRMRENGVTVSLDGHGVDEMMYGYKMLVKKAAVQAAHGNKPGRYEDLKHVYLDLFFNSEKEFQQKALESSLGLPTQNPNYLTYLKNKVKKLIGSDYLPSVVVNPFLREFELQKLSPLTNSTEDLSGLNSSQAFLYETFHSTTLPMLFRNYDRASMQNGIEIRMPFMDYRLVSFVFSLPDESLIGNGFTKKILRDSLSGIMPHQITERKLKLGFPIPLVNWVKRDCRDLFLDMIHSHSFENSNIWDGKKIQDWANNNYKQDLWNERNVNLFWTYINAAIITL